MDPFEYLINTEELAHSYIVRGDVEEVYAPLTNLISKREFEGKGSVDFMHGIYESFGVDESRAIVSFASLRPIGSRKVILIAAHSMTAEAQHGLLKATEEGIGHTHFFFVFEVGAPVLPTLLSRSVVLKTDGDQVGKEHSLGKEFLEKTYPERLTYVEKLAKEQNRNEARAVITSLLYTANSAHYNAHTLRDLLEAHQHLTLTGSSIKSVLGHVALVL